MSEKTGRNPAFTEGSTCHETEIPVVHILVTGAAGMLGRKLVQRLVDEPGLPGEPMKELTLHDIIEPQPPRDVPCPVNVAVGDLADPENAGKAIRGRPDVVFHLASVVSGEAEADFNKGYAANLDGTRNLLDAIRHAGDDYLPRVVFSSSIAVFGAPFPEQIPDDFFCTPLTSYGTQKAASELLLADYTRRGILDGIGIRLPTVCVRPGAPNKAASGFFSNIIREPLVGQEAILPVDDSVRHWFASPAAAVGFLLHAAKLDSARIGPRRSLTMPGVSVTVAEQIEALRKVAGEAAVRLIRREPDPDIERMVAGWPRDFAPERALALGFRAERSFEEIIRVHVEDELGGRVAVA